MQYLVLYFWFGQELQEILSGHSEFSPSDECEGRKGGWKRDDELSNLVWINEEGVARACSVVSHVPRSLAQIAPESLCPYLCKANPALL